MRTNREKQIPSSWPTGGAPGAVITPAAAGQWNDLSTTDQLPYVVMTPVPEPASLVLGLMGLLGFLRRRRS